MLGHPGLTLVLVESLLDWIAGGKSLRSWCAAPDHVSHQVIFRALRESSELRTRYARAREDQADTLVDECLAIADDGRNDTYVDAKGQVKVATDVIQRSRLRCDERHWQAGKLKPKVYGEKVHLEDVTPRSDEQIARRAAELLGKAELTEALVSQLRRLKP